MNECEQRDWNSGRHWIANDMIIKDPQYSGVVRISAKALNITWGNDKRFWQWINLCKEESIFETGADLLQVKWIQITRKLDLANMNLPPSTTYEIFYIVKFKVDAFGWHSAPIIFMVLENGNQMKTSEILEPYINCPDSWHEIPGGQFTVPADKNGLVEFGMLEVATDWWKGGMVLEGVKLKPKGGMVP